MIVLHFVLICSHIYIFFVYITSIVIDISFCVTFLSIFSPLCFFSFAAALSLFLLQILFIYANSTRLCLNKCRMKMLYVGTNNKLFQWKIHRLIRNGLDHILYHLNDFIITHWFSLFTLVLLLDGVFVQW